MRRKEIIKRSIMAFSWMENGEISAQEKPFEIFYWKKLAILSDKQSDVKYGDFLQLIKKVNKFPIITFLFYMIIF